MVMIVERVKRPAMLMWIIDHARKRCIFKTKAHPGWIDMRSNASDRVHQLIENAPMRNDKIASRRSAHETRQSPTRTQKQCPIALAFPSNGIIGGGMGRVRDFPNFLNGQPLHLSDVTLEQNGI